MKKGHRKIFLLTLLALTVSCVIGCGTSSNQTATATEMLIGQKEDFEFSALSEQNIAAADINYSDLEQLEEKIQNETDYEALAREIAELVEGGAEGFLLSDTSNLKISTFPMPLINVKDLTPGNIVYEFLFSGDDPVGYVMFFFADHKLSYSISLNRENTYGYYFDFLADHPNESFIVLTDGYTSYFLSEDNRLYNASTGNIVDDISITGDCYHAFSYDKIGVSYEEIVNQDILQTQPDNSTGIGTLPGAGESTSEK
jgi:hypothetical protein